MKRILVTGSRVWTDVATLEATLLAHGPGIVIHGACYPKPDRWGNRRLISADYIADVFVTKMAWEGRTEWPDAEPHPADWSLGKAAGMLRNGLMVDLGADVCLAFPMGSSVGTWDCVRRARAAGIETHIIHPQEAR